MSQNDLSAADPLGQIADEFVAAFRQGKDPSVEEFARRYPAHADEIRDMLPALVLMETARSADASSATRRPATAAAVPLSQLGDYQILREVGRGGMGIVYEAQQLSLGRHVAIKVLSSGALLDPRKLGRFQREARAAARLHHTNIVPVFGVGEQDGLHYYVMQFIPGLGLDLVLDELRRLRQPRGNRAPTQCDGPDHPTAVIGDVSAASVARALHSGEFRQVEPVGAPTAVPGQPAAEADLGAPSSVHAADMSATIHLPGQTEASTLSESGSQYWQSVARVGVQVAEALAHAASQGVLHRDIKPSNLLLDDTGNVWVADFGLAKADTDGDDLTHTGDVIGTLRYMAPERFSGQGDLRSDIYSLGLTLYELLTLRPAFDETDRHKLVKEVMHDDPVRPRKINKSMPRDLETVVLKAIARDPAHRYQTPAEMADDLKRFVEDRPIRARRVSEAERLWRWCRRNPGIAALGGVLTAVLVLVTIGSLIVAGRMSSLARKEAQERGVAEGAKKDAETSRQRAEAALQKAEEHFARARSAVNGYLTAVSEDERLKAPGLGPLRAQLLQAALGFYQEFIRERGSDPALRKELAAVYLKVGLIYADLGQPRPAGQSYAQARRLYEALAAEAPDDHEVQDGLAKSLSKLGQAARAVAIWEKLVRPDDPHYLYELGWAYHQLAVRPDANAARAAKPDPAKQLEFLRKALAVREQLVKLRPDDAEARQGLAASLNNIAASLPSEGREAERLSLYRRAVEEMEVAYKLRPHDLLTGRGAAVLIRNLAQAAAKLGHEDEAVAAYRRMVQVQDRLARDNPDYPNTVADVLVGRGLFAAYLREQGRLDEAARVVREGRDRAAEVVADEVGFFLASFGFHLEARAVAEARAKASADARPDVEQAAAAAVTALRNAVLAGSRNSRDLRTAPRMASLRDRPDFQDLVIRALALEKAEQVAKNAQSPPAEKVTARQECLAVLEALAASEPSARHARRALAQAHQDLGQAFLDAGQTDEARSAFDRALAVRQQLVAEAPANEQLRADLGQSQTAAGDLFAAAGKLADALKTWEKALTTLEEGLKANPNSIPFRTALSQQLLHVGDEASKLGLWDVAGKHYGRAVAVEPPPNAVNWNCIALVAAETRDRPLQRAMANLAARGSENTGYIGLFRYRALTTSPDTVAAHPEAVRKLGEEITKPLHDERWVRALAQLRTGRAEKALQTVAGLTPGEKGWPEWQVLALIQHRLGNARAAAVALQQADLLADRRMKGVVAGEQLKLPMIWDEWLHNQVLRAEAHQRIHGKPMPASPYERLFRGRVFFALGQPDKGEAEFAAAVAAGPEDADVWLTRSRVFARLGQKERMTADLLHAQQLKGDDPRTWIETGRMLAERGEHAQADAAFARASVLGKGELNRFLEAGWWVTGPYPDPIDLPCPPESTPDPSRPVAAVGERREFKWQSAPTTPHFGTINAGAIAESRKNATYYFLTYVHADRDRTATLVLRSNGDARLWVNGRLALDGITAWKLDSARSIHIPISLSAGRNTLLIKSEHKDNVHNWCECRFLDAPGPRGYELASQGLWAEAADAFAEADRRSPLDAWRMALWVRCLRAGDREDEARRVFEALVRRHDRPGSDDFSEQIARADPLPPGKSDQRERWVQRQEKECQKDPNAGFQQFWLGYAYYRAARFADAEKCFRRAIELTDELPHRTYLALCLQQQGQAGEARAMLQQVEKDYAQKFKDVLQARQHKLPLWWETQVVFLAGIREARTLIHGQDPGPDPSTQPLLTRGRERLAQLDRAEDHFARLVDEYPDSPRLWIDRGRRLGELGRWDEAAKAMARASELRPKDAQTWNDRGRTYAEFGKWDEAAADFVKAMELAPKTKSDWFAGSVKFHDRVVRLEEVFGRVAKRRPTDRQLWIQRVHYLARTARWPEAARATARVVELDPDDHLSWQFQAALLARAGDLEGYRKVCRDLLARFGDSDRAVVTQRIATACLIAPGGTDDPASLLAKLKRVKREPNITNWSDVTLALGHYREGQFGQAVKVLAPFVKASSDLEIAALAIRAMAQHKLNQPEAARQTLQQAREGLAQFAQPGPGELQPTWYNWHLAQLVLHEAEALLPVAPPVAQTSGSKAHDSAAQRERKARAERISTQAALAQIQVDAGNKVAAESELEKVLSDRAALAGEEPTNTEYQADLAAAHQALGQFLAKNGRIADAVKETQQAVAVLEKAAADERNAHHRVNLAANLFSIAEYYWKGGRLAEGRQAWQGALNNLEAARAAAAKDPGLAKRSLGLELAAARAYRDLGLWAEASGHFRRVFDTNPVAGTLPDRLNHAQFLLLTGKEDEYRRYCRALYERSGRNLEDYWGARMMVLRRGALSDVASVVELARAARDANPSESWGLLHVALAQLRADRDEDALATFQEFETISKREWQFSWPALALARHRAGKIDEAREWLRKTEEWYAQVWQKKLATDAAGLPPDGGVSFWAFFLCLRQEAIETVTGKPAPADPWFHLQRGRTYARLGQTAQAEAEFQAAVRAQPDDPRILLSRSRIYAALGKDAQSRADRTRAQQLAEQALVKRPDDTAAADALAGLLLEKVESKWTALKPLAVKSEGGATLTVQPDNSVLAGGVNPDRDVYLIEAEVQGRVGAIRLEAIPDPGMPAGGSGRADSGNFILSDLRVTAGQAVVRWSRAVADYNQTYRAGDKVTHFAVAYAIDADASTGWAIHPKHTEPHWAVFVPERPFGGGDRIRLTIRLAFQNKDWEHHALGRFRLSTAGESDALPQTEWSQAASSPQARVGAAYLLIGDATGAADFLTKATAANPHALAPDWLVLALAHAKLKNPDQARSACAKAAQRLKPTGADAALRPLLREVVVTLGTDLAEAKALIAAAAGEPPAALNEAIEQNPDKADGYRERANWYGERGRWKEAIADLDEAFRREPNAFHAMRLGILLAHTGEIERYRELSRAMLERWASTEKGDEADQTLKTVVLLPGFKADARQLARLAKVAVSGDKGIDWYEWYQVAAGLYECRVGQYADALATCRASRARASTTRGSPEALTASNLAIEAMALHGRGNAEEARRALEQARSVLGNRVPGLDGDGWHDWLAAHLLYREAEVLLAQNKPGQPK